MSKREAKTPMHLWVIAILAILWNLGGVIDYTMTQTRNAAYLGQFTPQQLAYFASFPIWFKWSWALGVWGGFAGSGMLLFRTHYAFHAFIIALVGIAGTMFWTLSNPIPASLNTPGVWVFNAAIIISIIALAWYSRRMTAAGVLR